MTPFDRVYDRLRAIMLSESAGQVVTIDEPGNLVVRTAHVDPGTRQAGWFGTVTIKKSYVAYHLMPLYQNAALSETVPDALSKRRQGKTCFNFKQIDEPLFAELAALTRRANPR